MRLIALAVPLLAAVSALGSTISALDKRYVTQDGTFRVSWYDGKIDSPVGVHAQFGCCFMYNYTEVPDGEPLRIGAWAPKFFFPASSAWAGKPNNIGLYGPSYPHCLDVGDSPGDGTVVRLQKCDTNKFSQRWRILINELNPSALVKGKVRLADTNLCLDVPDGNRTNNLQVWTCYRGNTNQEFSIQYHKKHGT